MPSSYSAPLAGNGRDQVTNGSGSTPPIRVLVVDDSKVIRDRLVTLLSGIMGVDVVGVASNGVDAVEGFDRLRPDVTILDIRMPGGSGLQALREIRARSSSTMLMILTNYPTDQYRKRCLRMGANHFLDKSADIDRLLEIVSDLSSERSGG